MKHLSSLVAVGFLALAAGAATDSATAQHSPGGHGGAGGHAMPAAAESEATAAAVIHSVDVAGAKVNLTHEPMPALGWPKMTMDLPVTRTVDLSKVKPGSDVMVTIKLGRDKQYRVTAIEPKK